MRKVYDIAREILLTAIQIDPEYADAYLRLGVVFSEQELFEGLEASSVNCWPSVNFDIGAINNFLKIFLPAGFYYKTFMWPKSFWYKIYEPFIRKAAGLGVASTKPSVDKLLIGLLRQEYRGYDSAGLAIFDDANQVQVNQPVRISPISPQAKSYSGRVKTISKVATSLNKDNSNATVTVTVELDKPSKVLIPGSRVDAEIVLAARTNAVLLNRDLIQGSGANAFVWVRDAQGKAQKRPVSLGLEGLIKVEVTSGLDIGEEVIVPSADSSLKPGMPLKVVSDK